MTKTILKTITRRTTVSRNAVREIIAGKNVPRSPELAAPKKTLLKKSEKIEVNK